MHADLLTCLYANLCLLYSLRFVVRVHHTLTLLLSPFPKKTSEEYIHRPPLCHTMKHKRGSYPAGRLHGINRRHHRRGQV